MLRPLFREVFVTTRAVQSDDPQQSVVIGE